MAAKKRIKTDVKSVSLVVLTEDILIG